MLKHTPGPWRIGSLDTAKANIRGGETSIALVYRNLGSPTLMDRDREGDGNVKIIAAVPNMLLLLRAFAALGTRTDDAAYGEFDAAMDDVRDLLAILDGESADV